MLRSISSVRSLLLAIFVLMAGSGFMATLISLRLEARGVSSMAIGLVATAYFAGLMVGSLRISAIIQSVGHIRAFAAFVSLFSTTALIYATYENVGLWTALRFVDGFCMAGVFVCLESWLSERAQPHTRGSILAAYMIALYAGQAIGQFLLNVSDAKPSMPFMASSILLSLAIIPVVLTKIAAPSLSQSPPLGILRLYKISPLGVVGATVTGLVLGAFYALGAVYVRRIGMSLSETSVFMSVVILGGVALQWPLGRLSDRFDRRAIIIWAFAGATAVCLAIGLIGAPGLPLMVLGCAFGGLTFALYPMCVAHTNDHLTADERVGASGGLVLVYGAGAAVGPVLSATAMTIMGPAGLFYFIALFAGLALAFAGWRQWKGENVPSASQNPYQILPRTTPSSAPLDPLSPPDNE